MNDAVARALREFNDRLDVFDPAPGPAVAEVRVGEQVIALRAPVVRALTEALLRYQDPRDRGTCDHCGSPRLDDNFVCADCARPSGVFGQLLAERASRYEPPAELT
ncbi:hypothetical protein Dvina_09850 [Dactylosporangium vinaceum]|uniref:Uncharacterized protein n=1 Tax=Dactylosporangium vinaceum TaxID=53362 RepID=A0ABV5MB83_9ACTN|nr:hypothetical protein [Dactylosporangium vinaceum]UAB98358.1 hypothetical protein Dvina_09850 [Dactylosporangium vinaceum]